VRRQFLGIDQGESGFVLVFPAISLSDGAKVREFAQEVRSLDLGNGQRLSAAGEAMILADIINMVTREMPRIFLAALIAVVLALALTLGSLRLALLCLLPTLASILALAGLMPLFGLPFNYLNIIVLTVLIGTTVDAGVHLVERLTGAGEDFVEVYSETGKAIVGGIMTSAVGFGAMLLADHPGLNSIGQLANMGFALNLVVMLLGFPAFLLPFLLRRSSFVNQGDTRS
jgi:predicted RND superfamily exporter protein